MTALGSSTAPCSVTVIGGGTMGRNIALNLLLHGHEVKALDTARTAISGLRVHMEGNVAMMRATGLLKETSRRQDRLRLGQSCGEAVANADLIVETIPENLEAKLALYTEIERHVAADTILASNTSSFMPSQLAQHLQKP